MFVDNGLLHSGGDQSQHAGQHAHRAGNHLAQGSLTALMFGDFAAADAFHHVASSAQDRHGRMLLNHRETLASVGTNARVAATRFAEMDSDNASRIRAVRCTYDT